MDNPDLDKLAIQKSVITPELSIDHYRFGKSLRKHGLEATSLIQNSRDIEGRIKYQIMEWVNTKAKVFVEAPSPNLEAVRWWKCQLDDMVAKIPCGGTHLYSLGELISVNVKIAVDSSEPEISIFTSHESKLD